jgi:hypothetical protein
MLKLEYGSVNCANDIKSPYFKSNEFGNLYIYLLFSPLFTTLLEFNINVLTIVIYIILYKIINRNDYI